MTAEPRDLAPTPAPQQPEQRPAEPVKAPETQPAGQVAQGEAPPEQPTPAQPPAESAPADAPPAAETPAPSGGLSLVDVRRLWPDLLESVKLKRRFTWIMLSQNAQVAAVDDRTLTIALLNAGARDSFLRSGSDEILRQAAIDVIGQDWRVETIVDPSAQPGAEPDAAPRITKSAVSDGPVPPTAPAAPAAAPPDSTPPPDWATGGPEASAAPEPSPEPARQPVDPAVIANARGSIQPTRATGPGGPKQPSVSDEDAHRDDPDADDHGLGGAELLERELGARVIEEIKHD